MANIFILIGIICFSGGFLSLIYCIIDEDFSPIISFGLIFIGFVALLTGGCLGSTNETVEKETNTEIGIIQIYDAKGNLIEEYEVQH